MEGRSGGGLHEGDDGENLRETQADSYVDRILTTFNMDGSFSLTDSQEDQLTWAALTIHQSQLEG